MRSNSLPVSTLPDLISRLGVQTGQTGIHANREWNLDTLAGRFAELSSPAASASLTAAISLIHQAQMRGEPSAWISTAGGTFYPPDVMASGIDLSALAVIRNRTKIEALRACEHLLRSGAFALVVLDLGKQCQIRMSAQSRLSGLARKHRSVVLCLTEKSHDSASIGSLISIRAEAVVKRVGFNQFMWQVNVIKDKRNGPNWTHCADKPNRGPTGLG